MNKGIWQLILFILGFAFLLFAGVYFQFCAPCSWHGGTAVKDLPARCLPQ